MMVNLQVTEARKSKVIQKTGFGAYDYCANPYVGCQFGCTYCYVRFFVKDPTKPWGEFVRIRNFINDKFPKELPAIEGKRLVIGTMTDPYQPSERKYRITRSMLTAILNAPKRPAQLGIFTRSPIIKDDVKLLADLGARVHITITPYERHILTKIEPIAVTTKARFDLAKFMVDNGVKVHISISPVMPVLSDSFTDEFVAEIVRIKPNGFTIDPMQAYGAAFEATDEALKGEPDWIRASAVILDKDSYNEWKKTYSESWMKTWAPHVQLPILPISMDHASGARTDLRTGNTIDFKEFNYG